MSKPTVLELWTKYLELAVPKGAGAIQVAETRRAFYAGAWTLFQSIMSMLDPGEEPTEADLGKMDALSKELDEWKQSEGIGR